MISLSSLFEEIRILLVDKVPPNNNALHRTLTNLGCGVLAELVSDPLHIWARLAPRHGLKMIILNADAPNDSFKVSEILSEITQRSRIPHIIGVSELGGRREHLQRGGCTAVCDAKNLETLVCSCLGIIQPT